MLMGCSVLTENKASNKDEFISLSAYSPKGGGVKTLYAMTANLDPNKIAWVES